MTPIQTMTEYSVAAAAKHWQAILRLQDWDIELVICDWNALNGAVGQLRSGTYRQATIKLLEQSQLESVAKSSCGPGDHYRDWEISLVHELLHIQFSDAISPYPAEDTPAYKALERAIDQTAIALVGLSRMVEP